MNLIRKNLEDFTFEKFVDVHLQQILTAYLCSFLIYLFLGVNILDVFLIALSITFVLMYFIVFKLCK